MRFIKFSRAKIFAFSLLAVVVIFASLALFSSASVEKVVVQDRTAPLNPEFIKFQEERKIGIPWPERTAEGFLLGEIPSPIDFSHLQSEPDAAVERKAYPSSYSLPGEGRVPPIRNQGAYGTCWAHATYGSLESFFGATALPAAGNFWDFSERHLAENHGFDFGVNDGGNATMSTAYLARWAGPILESNVPYWTSSLFRKKGYTVQKHVQDVFFYATRSSSTDNNTIKSVLTKYQVPIYVSMYWSNSCYNPNTYAYYNPNQQVGGHAVNIVGWNDNFSAGNFAVPGSGDKATPPGNGAFLVRNSWGPSWGWAGYFWVSYYDAYFARRSANVIFTGEATNNYKTKYEYDPLGWVISLGGGTDTGWFANIFKATSSTPLKAVSFYAAGTTNNYEIYVYTNATANQPRSGKLATTKKGKCGPGYFTFKITNVPLTKGKLFSIVVKLKTKGYNYPIPIERKYTGYSSKASSKAGQSFRSYDGDDWDDVTKLALFAGLWPNVCLKAFAK